MRLPDNFADDYELQPPGVRNYKEFIDLNYGHLPRTLSTTLPVLIARYLYNV